jgi:hypothetical protein
VVEEVCQLVCLEKWPSKLKNKDIRTWQKSLRVASSKCLHRRHRASPVSTFVKHEMTSEADKDVLMASPKSGDYVYKL